MPEKSKPEFGPAQYVRETKKGYPFGNRYPVRIRMLKTARTDTLLSLAQGRQLVAKAGEEYPAWTNSFGAVSAVFLDGEKLGLYPSEFEVVEWGETPEV